MKWSVSLIALLIFILLAAGCASRYPPPSPKFYPTYPCGNTYYNTSTQSCCMDAVYDGEWQKCGAVCFDLDRQSCCNGTLYTERMADCNGTCYPKNTHSCCNDQILEGTEWRACGSSCYDIRNETCCNGRVYEGFFSVIPCGSGTCFNSTTHFCCYERAGFTNPAIICQKGEVCCKDAAGILACIDPLYEHCDRVVTAPA